MTRDNFGDDGRFEDDNNLVVQRLITIGRDDETNPGTLHEGQYRDLRECLQTVAWQSRRAIQEEKKISLKLANLRPFAPLGSHLARANLAGIRLSMVEICKADLSGVRFQGADLAFSKLVFCDLTSADFTGADLDSINLQGSILKGVNFTRAQIGLGYFAGCDLRECEFRQANVHRLSLENADLAPFKAAVQSIAAAAIEQAPAVVAALDAGTFDGLDAKRGLLGLLNLDPADIDPEALAQKYCGWIGLGGSAANNGFAFWLRTWINDLLPQPELERLPGVGMMGNAYLSTLGVPIVPATSTPSPAAPNTEPPKPVQYEPVRYITSEEDQRNRRVAAQLGRHAGRAAWVV